MSISTQEDNITEVNNDSVISTQTEIKLVQPKKDGIYDLCNVRREKLLPFLNNNSMRFEKLARAFAFEINSNDSLKNCTQLSMIQAFYKCCEYGLDPAVSLGQAWMIPYSGKIDFQIGYRGWLKLLFNNPMVSNVYSYAVYKDDIFEYELGMNPNIKHIPTQGKQDKEDLIAAYGIVKFNNGESQIRVCWRDEINESMASSRGASRSDSPWKKHFEAMTLVVPIRKMGKNLGLPLRVEDFDEDIIDVKSIKEVI
ncbi:MAG: recombinase RecT [Vicingaceae bacterium]|jgi:recombination protein RecT